MGGTVGSKREGARWFGEEEAWENWGARGLKSAGCMYIVCWLVCLSGHALHLISLSYLIQSHSLSRVRDLPVNVHVKIQLLATGIRPWGESSCRASLLSQAEWHNFIYFPPAVVVTPPPPSEFQQFEGRIYKENLKTSMQEQNVGTQLTSNKTDGPLCIPSVWAIAVL